MKSCKIKDCANKYYSKGFCQKHYDKNRRHGDPLFKDIILKGTPCTVENCRQPIISNKLCVKHNGRFLRHGDPLFVNPKCNRDPGHEWTHKRALANTANWKKINKKGYNAYLASCKKKISRATPKWANKQTIAQVYKECPNGCQVDHIIPIISEFVSGLNVAWNLQYLSAFDNNSKNNKFDFTYDNKTWFNKVKKETK